MNILIVEDELYAAEYLQGMIEKLFPDTVVLDRLESVKKTISWFNEDNSPDLAFFDIQLADGLSFEVFDNVKVECPVIFTTAYDEYALQAFKVNSIDYLLKPIDKDELKSSIEKYLRIYRSAGQNKEQLPLQNLEEVIQLLKKQYKRRFLVKVGEHIRSIHADDILCFYSMAKASYIQTKSDRHYVMDHSLEQVEELVDPSRFFRVNRKFIIELDAIADIISYSNSRLKILLKKPAEEEIIVAREKVRAFKQWLEQ